MDEQESLCSNGWMHRYRIIGTYSEGVKEMCEICKDIQYFPATVPNYEYLKYHLRSALPRFHPRFKHEYK